MSLRVHFLGPTLAYSWLTLAASAQTFTVIPSLIPGIRVDGPETPAFAKHLADLGVDAKARLTAEAFLSRAIVVTNATDRPVAKVVVRFEFLDPSGRIGAEVQWQEPREGLAPGASRLVTVDRTITEAIRAHAADEMVRQVPSGSRSQMITRSPMARVSVDSVLFADGDFFGPDVSGSWGMLLQEQEFVKATRSQLDSAGADLEKIQRSLAEMHQPNVYRKILPGEDVRVRMMREKMFGELTYAARGGYDAFRIALQERFGEKAFGGLRRRF